MRKDNVKVAIASLLDLFRSGDIPEKIALVTNPDFDVPSAKWSLNNRLVQLFHGTMDSRGIRQWNKAGRKIKKGARAIFILAPRDFQYYECPCSKVLYNDDLEKGTCKKCNAQIVEENIKKGVSFFGVPVFKAEDTEGEPLAYENIPVPKHRFIDVAQAWNLEVKSSAFLGNAYGYYQRGQKIVLASPEEEVFYHELAHAAHTKLGLIREKRQDASNEIVAEFSAATLAYMEGKTKKLGNCFEYLEHYADKRKLTLEKAVLSLISEIEKVIKLILETEKEISETGIECDKTESEAVAHGVV